MSRLTRDGTAEPVSRDQILRHARGQGNIHFPCSADHEQDWQPYPVDPYSAICDDHTYIHTYTKMKRLPATYCLKYLMAHRTVMHSRSVGPRRESVFEKWWLAEARTRTSCRTCCRSTASALYNEAAIQIREREHCGRS